MAPWTLSARRSALLRRSLRLFLPISGAITLVLLPMVALYEHSRRETLEERVGALAQAATLRVQSTLTEARANTGVVTTVPALTALLAVVSLAPLARDFNRITNTAPALERGFLVSGEGRTINAPPGGAAGLHFAARYPQVWQQIQRQSRGVVDTGNGLFVFERGRARPHLAVVIQVPPDSLYQTSAFAQPAGQALVALLYLLAAGASVGIARYQDHLREQNAAERQLQERLQAVVQSAGVGMCLCDSHTGRFLTVNDALCTFFGRSEAELLLCTWQELTHPEDLAADQRLALQLQRGELDSYRLRKRFLRPDGGSIWGDLVVACTRNADGTVRDLIGQISDVSELVAKTAYLEAASSAGVVGVWDWDVAAGKLTWDAVMFRLYGLPPDQHGVSYEQWEAAVHPDDRSRAVQELRIALDGGQSYDCQFRVVWPNGSMHDIRARGNVEFSREGRPLRVVGVNYDVTEQVRRGAYLEAASSAGVVGVWDWDVPRDVLTWDPVMFRLYGVRGEGPGTREAWEKAVHPDDKPFVLQELQAALRGWREYQPRFRVVWPDGSIHHLQARSRTSYGPDGAPLRMIGVNYDITEQVEREQEVEQQRQLLATTLDALVDPLLVLTLVDRRQPRGASPPELSSPRSIPPPPASSPAANRSCWASPWSRCCPSLSTGTCMPRCRRWRGEAPPWSPRPSPCGCGKGASSLCTQRVTSRWCSICGLWRCAKGWCSVSAMSASSGGPPAAWPPPRSATAC